jgi:hypothetical protein
MGNCSNINKDTYGSRIRNLLTPLCNIITVMETEDNLDTKLFLDINLQGLKYSFNELLKLSNNKLLEENIIDNE